MTNTDVKIMREAGWFQRWEPIATAPLNHPVLVCDERNGKPYTVAKAILTNRWFYEGSVEPLDFTPGFWVEKNVQWNPFHLPLPGATS